MKGYWAPTSCFCCRMTDKKAYRKWFRANMKYKLRKEMKETAC